MGVSSLPKTVTRQRRSCDLNPGPTVPESSTLTTRLPSHPLEVGPLNPAMGSGERCKLPQRGPGRSPSRKTHLLAILSLENASGGNKTVLSVHLLGQNFT